jgi:Domain of unknown function (DUF4157)
VATAAADKTGKKQAGGQGSPMAAARERAQSETGHGPFAGLVALQGLAGNHAVGQLVSPSSAGKPSTAPPATTRQGLESSAVPLDPGTRVEMEARFGYDFGAVRLHSNAMAARSAQALGARAFTVGQDIVFGAGQYAQGTVEGKRLLAHELAHTVQQGRGGTVPPTNRPGSPLEQDAHQAAETVAQGRSSVQVSGASAPGPALQPLDELQDVAVYPTSEDYFTGDLPQSSLESYGESPLEEQAAAPASEETQTAPCLREQGPATESLPGKPEDPNLALIDMCQEWASAVQAETPGWYYALKGGQWVTIHYTEYENLGGTLRAEVESRIHNLKKNYSHLTDFYQQILDANRKYPRIASLAEWFAGVGKPGDALTVQLDQVLTNVQEAEQSYESREFLPSLVAVSKSAEALIEASRMIRGYANCLLSGSEDLKWWVALFGKVSLGVELALGAYIFGPIALGIAEGYGLSGASATLASGAITTTGLTALGAQQQAQGYLASKIISGEMPELGETLEAAGEGAKTAFPIALGAAVGGTTSGLLEPLKETLGPRLIMGMSGYTGAASSSLAQGLLEGKGIVKSSQEAQLMGLTGVFGGMLSGTLGPVTSRYGLGAYALGEGMVGFGTGAAGAYLTGGPVLQSGLTGALQSTFLAPATAPQLPGPGANPLLGGPAAETLPPAVPSRISWNPRLPWGERLALTGSSRLPSLIPPEGPQPLPLGSGSLTGGAPEWASPLGLRTGQAGEAWLNLPALPEPQTLAVAGGTRPGPPVIRPARALSNTQAAKLGYPTETGVDPRTSAKFWKKVGSETYLDKLVEKLNEQPLLIKGDPMEFLKQSSPTDPKAAATYVTQLHDFVTEVGKAFERDVYIQNAGKIVRGLASEQPEVRQAARFMLERVQPYRTELKGLQTAEGILMKFSLEDVQQIREHYDAETQVEVPDNELFSALGKVTQDINGSPADIRRLMNLAGGGTPEAPNPDLFALRSALSRMGTGPHEPDAIATEIQQTTEMARRISELSQQGDINRFIQGMFTLREGAIPQSANGRRALKGIPEFEIEGELSGASILSHFRRNAIVEGVVNMVTGGTGEISFQNFKDIETAIRKSDIPPATANNIVGYYWEQVRSSVRSINAGLGPEFVFEQVPIDIQGTDLTSQADLVEIVRRDPETNTIWIDIEEDKTVKTKGKGLSDAQEEVFNRVRDTQPGQPEVDATMAGLMVKLPLQALELLTSAGLSKNPTIMIRNFVIVNPYKQPEMARQGGS